MIQNDSDFFNVNVDNYNGPLDVLLDLAKSQKVNLEDISITKLADQFNDFIKNEKNLNLEIASEYLLMATWLAYLNLNYCYRVHLKRTSKFKKLQKS